MLSLKLKPNFSIVWQNLIPPQGEVRVDTSFIHKSSFQIDFLQSQKETLPSAVSVNLSDGFLEKNGYPAAPSGLL